MKLPTTSCLAALILAAVGVQAKTENLAREVIYDVGNMAELREVQKVVGQPDRAGDIPVVVRFAPATFVLEDTFAIARSNVTLAGQSGTRFVLADHVNKPVIAVGNQADYVTEADVIEDIVIRDLAIDGNKDNQDFEVGVAKPWIRNNGIDVRAVRRLTIERVVAANNRSGGLVISWGSSDVRVSDCVFERNFFDGIAFYTSTRILVTNCIMRDNGFAGISLDNNLLESEFAGCVVDSNGDVGIFARHSSGLTFTKCVIRNSGNWAVFLAHDENDRGVNDVAFELCRLRDNHGGVFMASVRDAQSSGTRVVSSTFRGNARDGRRNIVTSGASIWASDNVELN